jgi:hypothetical protein
VLDPFVSLHIIMQAPPPLADQAEAEAIIPMEPVSNDATMNLTVIISRKAAKRTLPWDLGAGELDLVSPPHQAEVVPARMKPRLEKHFSASTDEATRKTASPDVSEGLPPPVADDDYANADPVTETQPTTGVNDLGLLELSTKGSRAKAATVTGTF